MATTRSKNLKFLILTIIALLQSTRAVINETQTVAGPPSLDRDAWTPKALGEGPFIPNASPNTHNPSPAYKSTPSFFTAPSRTTFSAFLKKYQSVFRWVHAIGVAAVGVFKLPSYQRQKKSVPKIIKEAKADNTKQRKKANHKKFDPLAHPRIKKESPSTPQTSPKKTEKRKKSAALTPPPSSPPPSPPQREGRVPVGKTNKASQQYNKNMWTAFGKRKDSLEAARKRNESTERKAAADKASWTTARQEWRNTHPHSSTTSSSSVFNEQVTVEDCKNFALTNALKIGKILQTLDESKSEMKDERHHRIQFLAISYLLHRINLNLLEFQKQSGIHDTEITEELRLLFVHKMIDVPLEIFLNTLSSLPVHLVNELATLKTLENKSAYAEHQINKLAIDLNVERKAGPSRTEQERLAELLGQPLAFEPTLIATPLITYLEQLGPHNPRNAMDDITFLDYLTHEVFPLIHSLAVPLLEFPSAVIPTDIMALKQLLMLCGEIYRYDRQLPVEYDKFLAKCRKLIRNPIAHHVLIDEEHWHKTQERIECDVSQQKLVACCHAFQKLYRSIHPIEMPVSVFESLPKMNDDVTTFFRMVDVSRSTLRATAPEFTPTITLS